MSMSTNSRRHRARVIASGEVVPRSVDRLIHAAQDLWLDGLDTLVRTHDDALRVVETVAGDPRIVGLADNLVNGLGRIGQGLEDGAGYVFGRAGMATRKEVDQLSRRVSKLAREVEKLATVRRHGMQEAGGVPPVRERD